MATNPQVQSDSVESKAWLQNVLVGLGYLMAEWASDEPETFADSDDVKDALETFRNECGCDDDRCAYEELRRTIRALQTKLVHLGCYNIEQRHEVGVYDQATRNAVDNFKTQFLRDADGSRTDLDILAKYGNGHYSYAGTWLHKYHDSDFEALGYALDKLGYLDARSKTGQRDEVAIKAAARGYYADMDACLKSAKGVCTSDIQNMLRRKPPFTFEEILDDELAAVRAGRPDRDQNTGTAERLRGHAKGQATDRAHEAQLMGLCLSGGGIRSATFNLGVLQAFAQSKLLRRFDYLSSVSGGGYISGWLHAWVNRCREAGGITEVERRLANDAGFESSHGRAWSDTSCPAAESGEREPRPVAWLRRYSNYLTPQLGPLGADTMAAAATWLRNVVLNQTMLLLVVSSVLLLPWLFTWFTDWIVGVENVGEARWQALFFVGRLSLALAIILATLSIEGMSRHAAKIAGGLIFLACVLVGFTLSEATFRFGKLFVGMSAFAAYALPMFLLMKCGSPTSRSTEIPADSKSSLWEKRKRWRTVQRVAAGLFGGGLFGLSLIWLAGELPERWGEASDLFLTTMLAPLAVLVALLLAVTAQIGIAGRSMSEPAREWWSRLGGMVIKAGLLWLVLTSVSLYSAFGVSYVYEWVVALGGLTWVVTTLGGVITAHGTATGGSNRGWRELLARAAPYMFVAGLAVLVSWGLQGAIVWTAGKTGYPAPEACHEDVSLSPAYVLSWTETPGEVTGSKSGSGRFEQPRPPARCNVEGYMARAYSSLRHDICWLGNKFGSWDIPEGVSNWLAPILVLLGLPAIPVVIAWLLGLTVDVNVFALHRFYRNRLERCYLGASHEGRQAHPYTDLDPTDSPRLDELTLKNEVYGQRPYPLINVAINLTDSANLAWQERKAGSFVFTPQYCGYQLPMGDEDVLAYQRTSDYVKDIGGWIGLGSAMTVSGAAASPNAGYHTHPATALLMTVFNVRLGMWIQNPRMSKAWRRPGPRQSLPYLLRELLSSATEKTDFVYVSDGGHFENLGLYELIRRRCRYIVACDAGCDPEFKFEDLGNAVRKCKVDFGIDIEIDVGAIRPDPESGLSESHCAVGTIHYERVDTGENVGPGYLLYVKTSFTGDEPADVRQYRAQHAAFPHETTLDQWYSESQFESYRALGFHVMSTLLKDAISDEHRERHRRDVTINDAMREILEFSSEKKNNKSAAAEAVDREVLFKRLAERWYRRNAVPNGSRAHEQILHSLMNKMADDPYLRFLVDQIHPEWARLSRDLKPERFANVSTSTPTHRELYAGFHFCMQLIQLMSEIYEERKLEQEHAQPDNRGWMNLFHQWKGSGMFRATWTASAANLDARFQQFCGRHLGLDVGRVSLGRRLTPDDAIRATALFSRVERQRLAAFKEAYPGWPWEEFNVLTIELQADDLRGSTGRGFQFPVGFVLIEGDFGIERGQSESTQRQVTKNDRRICYFRIRDHLRRMGLGRRGLEALWREDATLAIGDDRSADVVKVIPNANPRQLQRLWHSMQIAVPHHHMQKAHELLEEVDEFVDQEIDGKKKDNRRSLSDIWNGLEVYKDPNIRDKLNTAHERFWDALLQQPDNEEALRGIARIKAYRNNKNDIDEAFQILSHVIELNPNAGLAFYNRAALGARTARRTTGEICHDLGKAIDLDYSLKKLARRDIDFDDMREDPCFVGLV